MARIPAGEGFGNVVAEPSSYRGPSDAARGAALGAGLQQAAGTLINVRNREEAEAAAARDAADRANAMTALQRARDDLDVMHDELSAGIETGEVDKSSAADEWQRLAKERITTALEGVPDSHKATVQGDLDSRTMQLGRGVGRAVTRRNQVETAAGIESTLESAQRSYAKDQIGAIALVDGALNELGPAAGWNPQQIAAKRQAWMEGAQFTSAYEAVSAGRDNLEALGKAEQMLGRLDALDPQKKAVLQDRATMYRSAIHQRQEAAARRVEAAQEQRMRVAQHSFNAFQVLADKGTMLDPAYIDRTLVEVAGTPYEAAVRGLAQQAQETGGLAARSPAELDAMALALDQHIAQHGRSPETDRRRDQLEKVRTSMNADMAKDPLPAALERGWITEIPRVDTSTPTGVAATVGERVKIAERVSGRLGRPVSPLTDPEATAVKASLDLLPAKERSAAVATMAVALGPQASAGLAAQMDHKDRPLALAFALAGSKTTLGRYTSSLVLQGAQAKKDGTSTKNEKQASVKPAEWQRYIAQELEGVYPSDKQRQDSTDAALLITHGLAAERGGDISEDELRQAVGLATGGMIVEHNGRRIPIQAGFKYDDLEKRLETITPSDIGSLADMEPVSEVRAAGVPIKTEDFVKTLPGQQLQYAGTGRYYVIVQGRPVTNSTGRPIVISMPGAPAQ